MNQLPISMQSTDCTVAQSVQDAERMHELWKYKIRKMNGNQNWFQQDLAAYWADDSQDKI